MMLAVYNSCDNRVKDGRGYIVKPFLLYITIIEMFYLYFMQELEVPFFERFRYCVLLCFLNRRQKVNVKSETCDVMNFCKGTDLLFCLSKTRYIASVSTLERSTGVSFSLLLVIQNEIC